MDESEKADLEVKGFSLVDISLENDSLISASSSSGFLIDLQSLEHLNDQTRKNGKCNLRKSLAWDSAFFTSAGVLDPEELSSMIDGVEKSGRNLLPGIEEDTRRSTDSISTLESESLTLDVLEADLFEDIRASIQKSSRASNVASSNSKSASQETEYQALHSAKKLDLPSPNMMKAKSASKKHPIVIKEQGRLIKQGSGCPQVKQMKPVPRNGDSSSSHAKPPKLIGRANPISVVPTKRASLGTSRVKMENDNVKGNTVANKGTLASKIPGLGVSRRVLPKPARSSKSSYMGSSTVTKTESTRSSSCDSSASASSDNIGRSPLNVGRKD
ncbi:hypothetical protein F0562_016426 [Nyssa sinensis]|uniref:Uncharacterized protein n=1 Tax=Nyssa sinensis TaxID=561372 RepID=A0A5J4ZJE2_9ASTE|nr:hypothetical protein F0562_016426 [Nyssa sinensis]